MPQQAAILGILTVVPEPVAISLPLFVGGATINTVKEKGWHELTACKVIGCNDTAKVKGFCSRHYSQWWKRQHGVASGPIQVTTTRTPNEIVDSNGYCEVVLRNKNGEEVARSKIDREDVVLVSKYKWRLHASGYAYSDGGHKSSEKIMMHRLVLGLNARAGTVRTREVDHINRDKLDNQKSNLRVVPLWVNQMNRDGQEGKPRIGVMYKPQCARRPWVAKQSIRKHTRHAYFSTYEEAVAQRIAWEEQRERLVMGAVD